METRNNNNRNITGNNPQRSRISELPPEIQQRITENLSASERVNLMLTSRAAFNTINPHHIPQTIDFGTNREREHIAREMPLTAPQFTQLINTNVPQVQVALARRDLVYYRNLTEQQITQLINTNDLEVQGVLARRARLTEQQRNHIQSLLS